MSDIERLEDQITLLRRAVEELAAGLGPHRMIGGTDRYQRILRLTGHELQKVATRQDAQREKDDG